MASLLSRTTLLSCLVAAGGLHSSHALEWHPACWALWSFCAWFIYTNTRGWSELSVWDRRHFYWGVISALLFLDYLYFDPDFEVGCPPGSKQQQLMHRLPCGTSRTASACAASRSSLACSC